MKKIIYSIILLVIVSSCSLFNSKDKIELIPFSQKGKYGYFDLNGKIAINPQFENASAFRNGLALVSILNNNELKWGFIDNHGKFVINAVYKSATVFQDDLAWVVNENSSPSAINKDGEVQFTQKDASEVRLFSENLAAYSITDSLDSSSWGFVDKSGITSIMPQFSDVGYFSDDKCAVQNKDGKWGYIDKTGKIIINYQFDSATKFENGKAIVASDNKRGVIDSSGKYLINPQFDYIITDDDLFLITQDNKVGWCDAAGKFVINPQFDKGFNFGKFDLAAIESGEKFGYIDPLGKIVINPQFDFATSFFEGTAIVKLGDKFGLIDKDGKYKVNPQFDDIGNDLFCYLYDYNSTYDSIKTDFFDINSILNIIDFDSPESLNLNDNFQTIATKLNLTKEDFSYSKYHLISSKKINDIATYEFYLYGNAIASNAYNYDSFITKEIPEAYTFKILLNENSSDKLESVLNGFIDKLKNYDLVKKGIYQGNYSSVYKSKNGIYVGIYLNHDGKLEITICNPSFDIATIINLISSEDVSGDGYEYGYDAYMNEGEEDMPYEPSEYENNIQWPSQYEDDYPEVETIDTVAVEPGY